MITSTESQVGPATVQGISVPCRSVRISNSNPSIASIMPWKIPVSRLYPTRAVPHGSADHPAHQPRAIAHQKTSRLRHYPDIGREVANGCVDSRADLFDGGNG